MSDSPKPSFLGAGLPSRAERPGQQASSTADDVCTESAEHDPRAAIRHPRTRALRSTPVLLGGLGIVLVGLVISAGWALNRDAGPGPTTVIEPDLIADARSQDSEPAAHEGAPASEAVTGSAPDDVAVESAIVDQTRPDASIVGHTVSAELCDALTVMLDASSAAMSAGEQGALVTPQLLDAYVALGEVPSPYQDAYRGFAALMSSGSAVTGAEAEAFTEAVRVDRATCL